MVGFESFPDASFLFLLILMNKPGMLDTCSSQKTWDATPCKVGHVVMDPSDYTYI